jgi:hypothetical protein
MTHPVLWLHTSVMMQLFFSNRMLRVTVLSGAVMWDTQLLKPPLLALPL